MPRSAAQLIGLLNATQPLALTHSNGQVEGRHSSANVHEPNSDGQAAQAESGNVSANVGAIAKRRRRLSLVVAPSVCSHSIVEIASPTGVGDSYPRCDVDETRIFFQVVSMTTASGKHVRGGVATSTLLKHNNFAITFHQPLMVNQRLVCSTPNSTSAVAIFRTEPADMQRLGSQLFRHPAANHWFSAFLGFQLIEFRSSGLWYARMLSKVLKHLCRAQLEVRSSYPCSTNCSMCDMQCARPSQLTAVHGSYLR